MTLRARLVAFVGVYGLDRAERFYGEVLGLRCRDERALWTSPSGGQAAWFRDPDGKFLSLTEGYAAPP